MADRTHLSGPVVPPGLLCSEQNPISHIDPVAGSWGDPGGGWSPNPAGISGNISQGAHHSSGFFKFAVFLELFFFADCILHIG